MTQTGYTTAYNCKHEELLYRKISYDKIKPSVSVVEQVQST